MKILLNIYESFTDLEGRELNVYKPYIKTDVNFEFDVNKVIIKIEYE